MMILCGRVVGEAHTVDRQVTNQISANSNGVVRSEWTLCRMFVENDWVSADK